MEFFKTCDTRDVVWATTWISAHRAAQAAINVEDAVASWDDVWAAAGLDS